MAKTAQNKIINITYNKIKKLANYANCLETLEIVSTVKPVTE